MGALYRVISKGLPSAKAPLASDVNQFVDLLNGLLDAGVLTLAPQISVLSTSGITGAPAAGTALGIGAYIYKFTYITGNLQADNTYTIAGETPGSASITVTTTAGNQNPTISGLPAVGTWPATAIGIRIYRTAVGGADGTQKLVTTLITNYARTTSQTSYTDTTADAALGAAVPTTNTTGTKFGSAIFSGPVTVRSDLGGALTIERASNTNQQVTIDYDATNNRGEIQAIEQGISVRELILNPSGGAVATKNNILDDGSGAMTILTSLNSGFTISGAGQTGIMFVSGAGGIVVGPTSNHPLILYANNSEKMRVNTDGTISVGGVVQPQLRYTNGYVEWNNAGTWQGVGGVKNVQRGSVTAATGVTTNVTITSVNMAKAFVTFANLMNPGGATQQVTISAFLANATTLSIVNNMPVAYTVYWEVVESY